MKYNNTCLIARLAHAVVTPQLSVSALFAISEGEIHGGHCFEQIIENRYGKKKAKSHWLISAANRIFMKIMEYMNLCRMHFFFYNVVLSLFLSLFLFMCERET